MKTIRYKITVLLSLLPLSATLMSCVEDGAYDDSYVTEKPDISYPTLSNVTIQDVTCSSAAFAARVVSDGNLEITDAGFVLSTSPEPTLGDGLLSCGAVEAFSLKANELRPKTTYYVRAYARNKRGTAMGSVSSFTTKDGTTIGCDGFADDNRLNDTSGGSIIGRGGYGDDNNLNDSSGGSIIGRGGYDKDNNLNGSSGGCIIDCDGYDPDNDLNDSSGGSVIGRVGYGEDENLNISSVSNNGPIGILNDDSNKKNKNNKNSTSKNS